VDPLAALLLEGARLRLEGYGDREVAGSRLLAVMKDFEGTESAREAAALLIRLQGRVR
jgi:hypothetical protein